MSFSLDFHKRNDTGFKAQGLVRPFRLLVHGTRYPTMTVQDRETPPITLEIHGAIVIVWIWPMGNVPD
ncbi:hypothetical protein AFLA_008155 [Aspergillus flavus NRRL3357]|nr:hypothetical protein AFLA_008155 [Aspergillus flavus NRRL3357]